jgi:hypothetical protein
MLSFPPSPIIGQVFPRPIVEGRPAWIWDGQKWRTASSDEGSGGFIDAPSDKRLYGRESGEWAEALSILGGALQGSLTINGELQTNIVRLGDENHWLWWTGSDYLLGGSGVPWTTGNMPAMVDTDGRVTSVYFDGGAHMVGVIDGWLGLTLANYDDISWVYSWVSGNFASGGAVNNFSNAVRLVLAADEGDPPMGSEPYSGVLVANVWVVSLYATGIGNRYRYVQYHIPNAGWITASAA